MFENSEKNVANMALRGKFGVDSKNGIRKLFWATWFFSSSNIGQTTNFDPSKIRKIFKNFKNHFNTRNKVHRPRGYHSFLGNPLKSEEGKKYAIKLKKTLRKQCFFSEFSAFTERVLGILRISAYARETVVSSGSRNFVSGVKSIFENLNIFRIF